MFLKKGTVDLMFEDEDFMGGAFDFDGDGKTSEEEFIIGMMIIDEMEKEKESKKSNAVLSNTTQYSRYTGGTQSSGGSDWITGLASIAAIIFLLWLTLSCCSDMKAEKNSYTTRYNANHYSSYSRTDTTRSTTKSSTAGYYSYTTTTARSSSGSGSDSYRSTSASTGNTGSGAKARFPDSYSSSAENNAGVTTTRNSDQTRGTTAKARSETKKDEYNAADYVDPDDFYYDHYDDFFDYEDAEDYYYEHVDD